MLPGEQVETVSISRAAQEAAMLGEGVIFLSHNHTAPPLNRQQELLTFSRGDITMATLT